MTERRLAIAPPPRTRQQDDAAKEKLTPLTIDTSGFTTPTEPAEPPPTSGGEEPEQNAATDETPIEASPPKKKTQKRSSSKQEPVETSTKSRLTLTVDEHLVDQLYERRSETGRTLASLVLDAHLANHDTVANSPTVEENRKRRAMGLSPVRTTGTSRKRSLVLFVTDHERQLLGDAAQATAATSTSEYIQSLLAI